MFRWMRAFGRNFHDDPAGIACHYAVAIYAANQVVETLFKPALSRVIDVADSEHMRGKTALRILPLIFAAQAPCGFGEI